MSLFYSVSHILNSSFDIITQNKIPETFIRNDFDLIYHDFAQAGVEITKAMDETKNGK